MNSFGNLVGEICKTLIPIPQEYYLGNKDSKIAVCTLSSLELLSKFENSRAMNKISIVGRLLSENKGIDTILNFVYSNRKIKTIIVCGKDVWGHKSGHSIQMLHQFGTDDKNRIINSKSPDPFLLASKQKIDYFRNEISLVNMIGITNFELINKKISSIHFADVRD